MVRCRTPSTVAASMSGAYGGRSRHCTSPGAADDRLVLAVDVGNRLRPDAPTSADRLFCHTYGRGRDRHLMIPGRPYSFIAALESGRTSWCQLPDAVRLGPEDDVAEVTAVQVRRVVEDPVAGGRWREGDPHILVVFDAGYDAPRMAHLPADLPVEVLGRLRSDRVMRKPCPARGSGHLGRAGRGHRTGDRRYGTARAMAWDRIHPRLTTRSAWIDNDGELPLIEGTLIRLEVDRPPGGGEPPPLWPWSSATGLTADAVDPRWQAFLRRFDPEHTFRMIKQTLGWTRPKLRTPEAADRGTWLIITAHTQLRLTRPLGSRVGATHSPCACRAGRTPAREHHRRPGPSRTGDGPFRVPGPGRFQISAPVRARCPGAGRGRGMRDAARCDSPTPGHRAAPTTTRDPVSCSTAAGVEYRGRACSGVRDRTRMGSVSAVIHTPPAANTASSSMSAVPSP